jgi:hypothetical protein
MIKKGDKCKVKIDYGQQYRKKYCRVVDFTEHGPYGTFAMVKWIGKNSHVMARDLGVKFPLRDLEKVS